GSAPAPPVMGSVKQTSAAEAGSLVLASRASCRESQKAGGSSRSRFVVDSVVKKFGTDPLFTAITINVDASVVDGVDQSFPPLAFDETARHIHGGVEVRTTSAEGFPNDVVVVKLETRTERPVNWIDVEVFFDAQTVNLVDI